jgi:hypothetical protein
MVFFLEFLTPSTLWGHNFLNSIFFLTTFNVPNAPIEGVQVFLGTRNIGAFSLDLDYLECLSILSPIDMLPTPSRTQMWVPNRKQWKSKESGHVPWFAALWRGRGACWSSRMWLGRIKKLHLLTRACTKPTQGG